MTPENGNRKSLEKPTTSKSATAKQTSIGVYESIGDFAKNGLAEILAATKSVNGYPQGATRDLFCAYPTFGKIIDRQSDRILELISKVLKWQNIKGNIQRRQPDEQFEMLLECNDAILERVGSNLDEMAGIKKLPQTVMIEARLNVADNKSSGAGSWNLKGTNETKAISARLITAKNIARPQINFKTPVDNRASTPFVPKLKDKPNSLKPLAILPEYDEGGNIVSYLQPYEFELMKFDVPAEQLKRHTPQMPVKTDLSHYDYIDSLEGLNVAIEELSQHTVIAVDVEHHSYRSFLGFTCLVQISTRDKDYLFDALKLREELHALNIIFTDPKVVKIFHGAELDVEWLQRDLSVYIVNMFDTHYAAKALNFARLSLAYLLKHYCDIDADKTFQLADWRIRPLPAQLVDYARQDTHYLIYIFEHITNDLLDAANGKANLLRSIYQRSTELCKKRFVKPTITSESHMDIFRKSKRIFDNRQLFALRDIFQWRDTIARQEDESYGYVLPNHMMLQMSESLPREMQGILACCNPIPPLVRQHMHTLHQIILRARQQPLVTPILESDTMHRVANASIKDYNNKLYCPHDLSHCPEFRDDLETIFDFRNPEPIVKSTNEEVNEANIKLAPAALKIFETSLLSEDKKPRRPNTILINGVEVVSPYQRYLAVLPLMEQEKREEAARLEAENKKRRLCPDEPLPLIKIEVDKEAAPKIKNENDLYNLPIKETLKRKYEESVANKAAVAIGKSNGDANEAPTAKRFKTETPADDKLKFVNVPPTKKELAAKKKSANRMANKSMEIVEISDGDSDGPPEEMPSTSQAQSMNNMNTKSGKKKNTKFKANRNQEESNKPVHTHFDYKNVDFKKFQGGAKRAQGTELRPQFHGKNNTSKAHNKKFNKLFTFGNVKGKMK